jgi:DNA-directed RNA polymerase specialized sigma24 family protein
MDLRALKATQQRALCLRGLGYSYREICQLTAATYTAVNRRITEGRAALRRLARERDRADDESVVHLTGTDELSPAPPQRS